MKNDEKLSDGQEKTPHKSDESVIIRARRTRF